MKVEEIFPEMLDYFSRNLPKRSLKLEGLGFCGSQGFPGKEPSVK
jgi:hypothetical protein